MGAEDFFINNGSDGQTVEDIAKRLPELDIVATTTLIVKAINTIDTSTLMIATQDEKVFGIADLEGK